MHIAVFDYKITPNNPIGGCHLRMLAGLCDEHDFVVFAPQFTNPNPGRIRWVRVPVPTRPLALLFVSFHLVAPIVYWLYRLRTAERFDLVQTVESNCWLRADVIYSQFCHRRFLRVHWPQVKAPGLRGMLRWLDHFLHKIVEPFVYRRAGTIVVASQGLKRELSAEYPGTEDKIMVVANPVELDRMTRPAEFDLAEQRARMGLSEGDTGLVFVALGQYERKGLPLILDAMKSDLPQNVKLCVVGGEADLVERYRRIVADMGLSDRVVFVGMQKDVRPFLWAADAFVLPSIYEVFPLVALEAAAAGVPVLSAPLNGVEEFLLDGQNGFEIERSGAGVSRGVRRLLMLNPDERRALGERARQDVRKYSLEQFHQNWRAVYDQSKGAEERSATHVTFSRPACGAHSRDPAESR